MTPKNPATLLASRREILLAGATAGAALLLPSVPRVARAATIPYDYACDKASAFAWNANAQRCVGYLTDFNGVGLSAPLARDTQVYVPWSGPPAPAYASIAPSAPSGTALPSTARVVGIIEHFSWGGGVGDVIQIDAWMSQENATQLKIVQQSALKTATISALGYWIADYDQQAKIWYEKAYPLTPTKLSGQVKGGASGAASGLAIDLTPTPAVNGVNVFIYKVSVWIVPAPNLSSMLQFASSSSATTKVVKPWGQVMTPVPPPTVIAPTPTRR